MSKIEITRHHQLSDQERAAALTDLATYLKEMGADVVTEGEQVNFSGRGYNGTVSVSPGLAEGYISLGLLARPFKRQLEKAIHEHLEARLAAP
ncbi:MAG: polyhydroxyalkanoic acid system family protein [Luminiphilus sp.]|nr:polyhydroxyalkanoic acid system family protein [Luminiphilus sp.]